MSSFRQHGTGRMECMWNRNYLLSITEFLEGKDSTMLMEEAFCKVDSERRSKAERMRTDRGKAACLGAGLLLQMAVREVVGDCGSTGYQGVPEGIRREGVLLPQRMTEGSQQRRTAQEAECTLHRYSVSRLLDRISYPIPLTYQYGKNGKPYFRDYPFYFNLSHSGDYVFCVLSFNEVGADIQQHSSNDNERLAERFFSAQEVASLQGCKEGKNDLFYRLWARKEAYGKLTGEGIAATMGINFLPGAEQTVGDRILLWEEYGEIAGYKLAICRYAAYF